MMITLENQRNVLASISVILLAANLYMAVSLARVENMVVLVPAIDREMTVGVRTVSEDYLLYRAEQVMQLLFNIRSENFSYNVEQILKQVASNNKAEFNKQLNEFTEDIKSKKYFYIFNKEGFVIDSKKLQVTFYGDLEVFVNDKKIDNNRKEYRLSFINNSGLVKLISFEEVVGEKA